MENIKRRNLNSFHKTAIILLKCIERKPGIRYRQLLRKTNLVNSVLSYHLGTLEKSKSIQVNRSSTVELAIIQHVLIKEIGTPLSVFQVVSHYK